MNTAPSIASHWIVEVMSMGEWRAICRPIGGVRFTYDTRDEADAAAGSASAAMGGREYVRVLEIYP
jgi:hypothetical protein